MIAIPTGIVFYGVCQVQAESCSAKDGGAVTAVRTLPGEEQVNVCRPCLDTQIKKRIWSIEGASVPGMRQQLDVAAIDQNGQVILAVEVKNWAHSTPQWATRLASQMTARREFAKIPYFLVATPSTFYVWRVIDGLLDEASLQEIEVTDQLTHLASTKGLSKEQFSVSDGSEFRNTPTATTKKHLMLQRIVAQLLSDHQIESQLSDEMGSKLKNSTIRMEYVLPSE